MKSNLHRGQSAGLANPYSNSVHTPLNNVHQNKPLDDEVAADGGGEPDELNQEDFIEEIVQDEQEEAEGENDSSQLISEMIQPNKRDFPSDSFPSSHPNYLTNSNLIQQQQIQASASTKVNKISGAQSVTTTIPPPLLLDQLPSSSLLKNQQSYWNQMNRNHNNNHHHAHLPLQQQQQQLFSASSQSEEFLGNCLETLREIVEKPMHRNSKTLLIGIVTQLHENLTNEDKLSPTFKQIIKSLNGHAVSILDEGEIDLSITILKRCQTWTKNAPIASSATITELASMSALTQNHLACAYRRKNDIEKALRLCNNALQTLQTHQISKYLPTTYLNLSALSSQLLQHDKALNYARCALLESQRQLLEHNRKTKNTRSNNEYNSNQLVGASNASPQHQPSPIGSGSTNAIVEEQGEEEVEEDETEQIIRTLVISYHNIAIEEEHFLEFDSALRNYASAARTAIEYLGEQHQISVHFQTQYLAYQDRINNNFINNSNNNNNNQQYNKKLKKHVQSSSVSSPVTSNFQVRQIRKIIPSSNSSSANSSNSNQHADPQFLSKKLKPRKKQLLKHSQQHQSFSTPKFVDVYLKSNTGMNFLPFDQMPKPIEQQIRSQSNQQFNTAPLLMSKGAPEVAPLKYAQSHNQQRRLTRPSTGGGIQGSMNSPNFSSSRSNNINNTLLNQQQSSSSVLENLRAQRVHAQNKVETIEKLIHQEISKHNNNEQQLNHQFQPYLKLTADNQTPSFNNNNSNVNNQFNLSNMQLTSSFFKKTGMSNGQNQRLLLNQSAKQQLNKSNSSKNRVANHASSFVQQPQIHVPSATGNHTSMNIFGKQKQMQSLVTSSMPLNMSIPNYSQSSQFQKQALSTKQISSSVRQTPLSSPMGASQNFSAQLARQQYQIQQNQQQLLLSKNSRAFQQGFEENSNIPLIQTTQHQQQQLNNQGDFSRHPTTTTTTTEGNPQVIAESNSVELREVDRDGRIRVIKGKIAFVLIQGRRKIEITFTASRNHRTFTHLIDIEELITANQFDYFLEKLCSNLLDSLFIDMQQGSLSISSIDLVQQILPPRHSSDQITFILARVSPDQTKFQLMQQQQQQQTNTQPKSSSSNSNSPPLRHSQPQFLHPIQESLKPEDSAYSIYTQPQQQQLTTQINTSEHQYSIPLFNNYQDMQLQQQQQQQQLQQSRQQTYSNESDYYGEFDMQRQQMSQSQQKQLMQQQPPHQIGGDGEYYDDEESSESIQPIVMTQFYASAYSKGGSSENVLTAVGRAGAGQSSVVGGIANSPMIAGGSASQQGNAAKKEEQYATDIVSSAMKISTEQQSMVSSSNRDARTSDVMIPEVEEIDTMSHLKLSERNVMMVNSLSSPPALTNPNSNQSATIIVAPPSNQSSSISMENSNSNLHKNKRTKTPPPKIVVSHASQHISKQSSSSATATPAAVQTQSNQQVQQQQSTQPGYRISLEDKKNVIEKKQKVEVKEKEEEVVEEPPIDINDQNRGEFEKAASLIGMRYKQRKMNQQNNNNTKLPAANVNQNKQVVKEEVKINQNNGQAQQKPKQEVQKEEEKVVLDGPIEEYEKAASMIGAAFRNRKKNSGIAKKPDQEKQQQSQLVQQQQLQMQQKQVEQQEDPNKVVLDGPIEEYEKAATMIGAAFRNRKKNQKSEQKNEGKQSTVAATATASPAIQVVVEQSKKPQEEPVQLDGPIEEYEKAASMIGAAFRNRKKNAVKQASPLTQVVVQQQTPVIVEQQQSKPKERVEEVVVLEGPVEEYEKVASLIGAAYRNKKRKENQAKQIQQVKQNNQMLSQHQQEQKQAPIRSAGQQMIVLEGPIDDFQDVENKIGAAYKLRKQMILEENQRKQEFHQS